MGAEIADADGAALIGDWVCWTARRRVRLCQSAAAPFLPPPCPNFANTCKQPPDSLPGLSIASRERPASIAFQAEIGIRLQTDVSTLLRLRTPAVGTVERALDRPDLRLCLLASGKGRPVHRGL